MYVNLQHEKGESLEDEVEVKLMTWSYNGMKGRARRYKRGEACKNKVNRNEGSKRKTGMTDKKQK